MALIGKEVSAAEWANAFNGGSVRVFKVLQKDNASDLASGFAATHRGFTYKRGLNEDSAPFDPTNKCGRGGLYFCTRANVSKFEEYGDTVGEFNLCLDSRVYIDPYDGGRSKAKTDCMVLISTRSLREFYASLTREEKLEAVKRDGCVIRHFAREERSDELKLAAVSQDGDALCCLSRAERSHSVNLAAVTQNGCAICYLSRAERSYEVKLAAVKQDRFAMHYLELDERTDKIEQLAKS